MSLTPSGAYNLDHGQAPNPAETQSFDSAKPLLLALLTSPDEMGHRTRKGFASSPEVRGCCQQAPGDADVLTDRPALNQTSDSWGGAKSFELPMTVTMRLL